MDTTSFNIQSSFPESERTQFIVFSLSLSLTTSFIIQSSFPESERIQFIVFALSLFLPTILRLQWEHLPPCNMLLLSSMSSLDVHRINCHPFSIIGASIFVRTYESWLIHWVMDKARFYMICNFLNGLPKYFVKKVKEISAKSEDSCGRLSGCSPPARVDPHITSFAQAI